MNKLLGVVLATILVLFGTVVPVSAETVNGTNITSRLAGQDHYQTSVAIAEAYNNNGECGNVILASGDSFPDALSASILSKKLNAPILLVGTTVNDSNEAFNYLYTHESRQRGTVYIVGGTGVIGQDFETKLASMMFTNIKRLGGTDRYDTNMLIVNDVNVPQGTPVFIASGENFPDALSISSFSGSKQYPTLLVGADYLPDKTKGYLISEKPSAVYIAGGTSVVSQDIENQIKTLVPGATVTRLAGDDRLGTNAAVLNEFSPAPDTIYLANGDNFPDVLAGSALAAKIGNPIILVDNQLSTLSPALEAYLEKLKGSGIQPDVIALGGTRVDLNILVEQIRNALNENSQEIAYSRIAVGAETTYYLDSSGHVWAWGDGTAGQLGNGTKGNLINSINNIPIYGSTVPVQVSGLTNIVSIASGGSSTCYALDSFGQVWAWGFGENGELGNGTRGSSSTPVRVLNLTHIISIAAGAFSGYYALDSSGHVWPWDGGPGQVTNLKNIVSLNVLGGEAYAFDSSGHVWFWGSFSNIVNGTINTLTTNTQTTSDSVVPYYDSYIPIQLSNLTNIVSIAGGGINTRNALDSSGHVWEFTFVNGTTSEIQTTTPIQVSNLSNIVAISGRGSTNDKSGYALDSSGHVWAWGVGAYDELVKGNTMENKSTPVQVSNLSNIVEIAGEGSNGYALDSAGHVWAWGLNGSGQLGNGTITSSSTPVQVLGLPK